jgi:hypothetical protein
MLLCLGFCFDIDAQLCYGHHRLTLQQQKRELGKDVFYRGSLAAAESVKIDVLHYLEIATCPWTTATEKFGKMES